MIAAVCASVDEPSLVSRYMRLATQPASCTRWATESHISIPLNCRDRRPLKSNTFPFVDYSVAVAMTHAGRIVHNVQFMAAEVTFTPQADVNPVWVIPNILVEVTIVNHAEPQRSLGSWGVFSPNFVNHTVKFPTLIPNDYLTKEKGFVRLSPSVVDLKVKLVRRFDDPVPLTLVYPAEKSARTVLNADNLMTPEDQQLLGNLRGPPGLLKERSKDLNKVQEYFHIRSTKIAPVTPHFVQAENFYIQPVHNLPESLGMNTPELPKVSLVGLNPAQLDRLHHLAAHSTRVGIATPSSLQALRNPTEANTRLLMAGESPAVSEIIPKTRSSLDFLGILLYPLLRIKTVSMLADCLPFDAVNVLSNVCMWRAREGLGDYPHEAWYDHLEQGEPEGWQPSKLPEMPRSDEPLPCLCRSGYHGACGELNPCPYHGCGKAPHDRFPLCLQLPVLKPGWQRGRGKVWLEGPDDRTPTWAEASAARLNPPVAPTPTEDILSLIDVDSILKGPLPETLVVLSKNARLVEYCIGTDYEPVQVCPTFVTKGAYPRAADGADHTRVIFCPCGCGSFLDESRHDFCAWFAVRVQTLPTLLALILRRLAYETDHNPNRECSPATLARFLTVLQRFQIQTMVDASDVQVLVAHLFPTIMSVLHLANLTSAMATLGFLSCLTRLPLREHTFFNPFVSRLYFRELLTNAAASRKRVSECQTLIDCGKRLIECLAERLQELAQKTGQSLKHDLGLESLSSRLEARAKRSCRVSDIRSRVNGYPSLLDPQLDDRIRGEPYIYLSPLNSELFRNLLTPSNISNALASLECAVICVAETCQSANLGSSPPKPDEPLDDASASCSCEGCHVSDTSDSSSDSGTYTAHYEAEHVQQVFAQLLDSPIYQTVRCIGTTVLDLALIREIQRVEVGRDVPTLLQSTTQRLHTRQSKSLGYPNPADVSPELRDPDNLHFVELDHLRSKEHNIGQIKALSSNVVKLQLQITIDHEHHSLDELLHSMVKPVSQPFVEMMNFRVADAAQRRCLLNTPPVLSIGFEYPAGHINTPGAFNDEEDDDFLIPDILDLPQDDQMVAQQGTVVVREAAVTYRLFSLTVAVLPDDVPHPGSLNSAKIVNFTREHPTGQWTVTAEGSGGTRALPTNSGFWEAVHSHMPSLKTFGDPTSHGQEVGVGTGPGITGDVTFEYPGNSSCVNIPSLQSSLVEHLEQFPERKIAYHSSIHGEPDVVFCDLNKDCVDAHLVTSSSPAKADVTFQEGPIRCVQFVRSERQQDALLLTSLYRYFENQQEPRSTFSFDASEVQHATIGWMIKSRDVFGDCWYTPPYAAQDFGMRLAIRLHRLRQLLPSKVLTNKLRAIYRLRRTPYFEISLRFFNFWKTLTMSTAVEDDPLLSLQMDALERGIDWRVDDQHVNYPTPHPVDTPVVQSFPTLPPGVRRIAPSGIDPTLQCSAYWTCNRTFVPLHATYIRINAESQLLDSCRWKGSQTSMGLACNPDWIIAADMNGTPLKAGASRHSKGPKKKVSHPKEGECNKDLIQGVKQLWAEIQDVNDSFFPLYDGRREALVRKSELTRQTINKVRFERKRKVLKVREAHRKAELKKLNVSSCFAALVCTTAANAVTNAKENDEGLTREGYEALLDEIEQCRAEEQREPDFLAVSSLCSKDTLLELIELYSPPTFFHCLRDIEVHSDTSSVDAVRVDGDPLEAPLERSTYGLMKEIGVVLNSDMQSVPWPVMTVGAKSTNLAVFVYTPLAVARLLDRNGSISGSLGSGCSSLDQAFSIWRGDLLPLADSSLRASANCTGRDLREHFSKHPPAQRLLARRTSDQVTALAEALAKLTSHAPDVEALLARTRGSLRAGTLSADSMEAVLSVLHRKLASTPDETTLDLEWDLFTLTLEERRATEIFRVITKDPTGDHCDLGGIDHPTKLHCTWNFLGPTERLRAFVHSADDYPSRCSSMKDFVVLFALPRISLDEIERAQAVIKARDSSLLPHYLEWLPPCAPPKAQLNPQKSILVFISYWDWRYPQPVFAHHAFLDKRRSLADYAQTVMMALSRARKREASPVTGLFEPLYAEETSGVDGPTDSLDASNQDWIASSGSLGYFLESSRRHLTPLPTRLPIVDFVSHGASIVVQTIPPGFADCLACGRMVPAAIIAPLMGRYCSKPCSFIGELSLQLRSAATTQRMALLDIPWPDRIVLASSVGIFPCGDYELLSFAANHRGVWGLVTRAEDGPEAYCFYDMNLGTWVVRFAVWTGETKQTFLSVTGPGSGPVVAICGSDADWISCVPVDRSLVRCQQEPVWRVLVEQDGSFHYTRDPDFLAYVSRNDVSVAPAVLNVKPPENESQVAGDYHLMTSRINHRVAYARTTRDGDVTGLLYFSTYLARWVLGGSGSHPWLYLTRKTMWQAARPQLVNSQWISVKDGAMVTPVNLDIVCRESAPPCGRIDILLCDVIPDVTIPTSLGPRPLRELIADVNGSYFPLPLYHNDRATYAKVDNGCRVSRTFIAFHKDTWCLFHSPSITHLTDFLNSDPLLLLEAPSSHLADPSVSCSPLVDRGGARRSVGCTSGGCSEWRLASPQKISLLANMRRVDQVPSVLGLSNFPEGLDVGGVYAIVNTLIGGRPVYARISRDLQWPLDEADSRSKKKASGLWLRVLMRLINVPLDPENLMMECQQAANTASPYSAALQDIKLKIQTGKTYGLFKDTDSTSLSLNLFGCSLFQAPPVSSSPPPMQLLVFDALNEEWLVLQGRSLPLGRNLTESHAVLARAPAGRFSAHPGECSRLSPTHISFVKGTDFTAPLAWTYPNGDSTEGLATQVESDTPCSFHAPWRHAWELDQRKPVPIISLSGYSSRCELSNRVLEIFPAVPSNLIPLPMEVCHPDIEVVDCVDEALVNDSHLRALSVGLNKSLWMEEQYKIAVRCLELLPTASRLDSIRQDLLSRAPMLSEVEPFAVDSLLGQLGLENDADLLSDRPLFFAVCCLWCVTGCSRLRSKPPAKNCNLEVVLNDALPCFGRLVGSAPFLKVCDLQSQCYKLALPYLRQQLGEEVSRYVSQAHVPAIPLQCVLALVIAVRYPITLTVVDPPPSRSKRFIDTVSIWKAVWVKATRNSPGCLAHLDEHTGLTPLISLVQTRVEGPVGLSYSFTKAAKVDEDALLRSLANLFSWILTPIIEALKEEVIKAKEQERLRKKHQREASLERRRNEELECFRQLKQARDEKLRLETEAEAARLREEQELERHREAKLLQEAKEAEEMSRVEAERQRQELQKQHADALLRQRAAAERFRPEVGRTPLVAGGEFQPGESQFSLNAVEFRPSNKPNNLDLENLRPWISPVSNESEMVFFEHTASVPVTTKSMAERLITEAVDEFRHKKKSPVGLTNFVVEVAEAFDLDDEDVTRIINDAINEVPPPVSPISPISPVSLPVGPPPPRVPPPRPQSFSSPMGRSNEESLKHLLVSYRPTC